MYYQVSRLRTHPKGTEQAWDIKTKARVVTLTTVTGHKFSEICSKLTLNFKFLVVFKLTKNKIKIWAALHQLCWAGERGKNLLIKIRHLVSKWHYGSCFCSLGAFIGHWGWMMVIKMKNCDIADLPVFFSHFYNPYCIFNALVKYSAPLLKTMDSNKKSLIKSVCEQFKNLKKIRVQLEWKGDHVVPVSVKYLHRLSFSKLSLAPQKDLSNVAMHVFSDGNDFFLFRRMHSTKKSL